MSKLRDELEGLAGRAYCTGQDDFPSEDYEADTDSAEQAIKDLFLELVGKDEVASEFGSGWDRNNLRATQRKQIEEL